MKPILSHIRAILLIAFTMSVTFVFAQTTDSRYKSRLEVKPKQKTMNQIINSTSFKKKPFSYFQPSHLSLDRNINYQRSTAIRQYFTNSLMVQAPKSNAHLAKTETPSLTSTESNKAEEAISTEDRLFNNEKLIVSNIYPNPADDYATIDYVMTSQVNEVKITFYNVLGSEVKEEVLDKEQGKLRISTKEWGNGIYLYQLSADGRSLVTKKLLVRHQ